MAVTAQQIVDFLVANPNISDADLAAVMDAYKVTPEQVAQATNTSVAEAQQRYEAVTAPPPVYEPVYQPVYEEPVYQPPVEVYTPPAETYYRQEPEIDYYAQQFAPDVFEAPVVVPPVVTQSVATQNVDSLIRDGNLNPTQISAVTGVPIGEIITKAAALAPFQGSTKLGDTYVSPNYSYTQSGEETIVGGLESIGTSKVSSEQGSRTELYSPSGELTNVGTYDKGPSFFGGLAQAFNDPVVQAAFLGLGGGGALGNALGLTGSTAQAVGTGLFKGGSALAGGADLEDALATGLLSGGLVYGGNALNNYLTTGSTADVGITERQFAIQDAKQLADQGLSATQIRDAMTSGGYNEAIIDRAITAVTPTTVDTSTAVTTPVTDGVTITGQAPTSLGNVINTIASTVPTNLDTVQVTGDKAVNTQDAINAITSNLTTTPTAVTTPIDTVQVTANNPNTLDLNSVINLINAGNLDTTNLVNNVADTTKLTDDTGKKKEELTTSDVIRLVGAGTTLAAMDAANQGTDAGGQFPIIPIPADWKGQPPTVIAPRPRLQPIDFGSRNLLQGTQWEKFLSPTYGQVPAPVQYSQPSNMSYNDLMSILGSKQGYPSSANLSINDIISGIQNQYGQTPTRTMG